MTEYDFVNESHRMVLDGILPACRYSVIVWFGGWHYVISTWPRGYKSFFVPNSVEHEILNAHKYTNTNKFGLFKAQLSLECYFSRSYMLKCQQLLAF